MTVGKIQKPNLTPIRLPVRLARIAYISSCVTMDLWEYPSAFSVPISILWSSTILVMVVSATSMATRRKISGK